MLLNWFHKGGTLVLQHLVESYLRKGRGGGQNPITVWETACCLQLGSRDWRGLDPTPGFLALLIFAKYLKFNSSTMAGHDLAVCGLGPNCLCGCTELELPRAGGNWGCGLQWCASSFSRVPQKQSGCIIMASGGHLTKSSALSSKMSEKAHAFS